MAAPRELRELLQSANCVLFDFDGPVCRLFARHPAERVAKDMVRWLAERQGRDGLADKGHSGDPHAVLRSVARANPGSGLVADLEAQLTWHELKAAGSAEPTPFAHDLIRTLRAKDYALAITTNNSARVVSSYLAGVGLIDCFAPHIHGRTEDVLRLKPDPDCLFRALDSTGATAAESLMIGDTRADCEAARKAGVPFLGYGRNKLKMTELRMAGAGVAVTSMEPVLRLVRGE